jgi:hypothetical protein
VVYWILSVIIRLKCLRRIPWLRPRARPPPETDRALIPFIVIGLGGCLLLRLGSGGPSADQ